MAVSQWQLIHWRCDLYRADQKLAQLSKEKSLHFVGPRRGRYGNPARRKLGKAHENPVEHSQTSYN